MIVAVAIGFGSCTKIDEIKNLSIPKTFETPVSLIISDTDTNVFVKEMVIDAAGDQEIKDNISNLSGFNLKKLSYKVTSFTGNPSTVADAKLQFFNAEGNFGSPITIDPILFESMVASDTEMEIPISEDLRSILEEKLLSDQTFSMRFYGMVNLKPMMADLTVFVSVEALVEL